MNRVDWERVKIEMEVLHLEREMLDLDRKILKQKKFFRIFICIMACSLTFIGTMVMLKKITITLKYKYISTKTAFAPLLGEEGYNERIEQIEDLMQLNNQYYGVRSNLPGRSGRLKTYDIEKDKLRFENLGSYNSQRGMCLGFSIFEKLNYMDTLAELNEDLPEEIQLRHPKRKDLGEIQLDAKDKQQLYGGGTSRNLEAKLLYDFSINVYEEKREDFSDKIENEQAYEILNVINYIQEEAHREEEKYPTINIEPREYYSVKSAAYFKNISEAQLEPEWITKKIDEDEPVVIGLGTSQGGHAVLVYEYEYVAEDILKLYVSDSNLEILSEETTNEERLKEIKRYNQDVKENVYILCVKDEETQRWEYIYNPKVNGKYLYRGEYNSYIPEVSMTIYQ